MDFFGIMKSLFFSISKFFSFRINFNGFDFFFRQYDYRLMYNWL